MYSRFGRIISVFLFGYWVAHPSFHTYTFCFPTQKHNTALPLGINCAADSFNMNMILRHTGLHRTHSSPMGLSCYSRWLWFWNISVVFNNIYYFGGQNSVFILGLSIDHPVQSSELSRANYSWKDMHCWYLFTGIFQCFTTQHHTIKLSILRTFLLTL